MKSFLQHLIETEENNSPSMEGIDIDILNKTVSFNKNHENNVDTSDIINPTYYKVNGFDVISIFKRKQNDFGLDGNPLIKALKELDGWKLNNCKSDTYNLLKQFIKITNKIENKYDTIIVVPSSNKLNTEFLHKLNNIIECDNVVENIFKKLTTADVLDFGLDRELIKKQKNPTQIMNDILSSIKQMNNKNGGIFSYKYIPTSHRKYFLKTIEEIDNKNLEYSSMINDKNILILDDTISTGSTISETANLILKTYQPKNITIITLFSSI